MTQRFRMFPKRRAQESSDGYAPFTRAYDRVVCASNLDTVLGPLSVPARKSLDDAWEAFQSGLLAWRAKTHLLALETAESIRRTTDSERLKNTVISLLIDQSGSMRGQSMLLAAATADVAQDFLRHLGCRVEILGFTTSSWRGGKSRRRWRLTSSRRNPGRLCDLLHIIYQTADEERASTGSWTFRNMLRPDLPKENVDGEALLWASERLRRRPEARKIICIISDGAPVDDSTLLANGPDILERHLRLVIDELCKEGVVELTAVGIGFDVARYYEQASVVQTPEDLGTAVIGQLGEVLSRRSADLTTPTAHPGAGPT